MPIIQTDKPLRPREANDFYMTPQPLIKAVLSRFQQEILGPRDVNSIRTILEPGSGPFAPWAKEAHQIWRKAKIDAVELISSPHSLAFIRQGRQVDFREAKFESKYDLVIGNPPYKHAEEFVRKAHNIVTGRGHIVYLLRTAFLESNKRVKGLWADLPPSCVWVLAQRPSFYHNKKTNATCYSIFIWGPERGKPELGWLNWR